ncbi:MAG: nuclear transport factor 2 family protein [Actinomycetota bacterium]
MSQENVKIVRRSVDAWNRRDEEEMLALIDPEAEFVNAPNAVEPGTRRGTNDLPPVSGRFRAQDSGPGLRRPGPGLRSLV